MRDVPCNKLLFQLWFLCLGVVQIIYAVYAMMQVNNNNMAENVYHAIILFLLIVNLIIVYGFYRRDKQNVQARKQKEAQYLMQIEQMNYQVIEERRLQVAKIRHDLNNQLAAVEQLLREEQGEYAAELLEEIEMRLQEGTGAQYCNDPLINIVLNDKKRLFEKENIAFDMRLSSFDKVFVEQQTLCSVFSNILQMALQYCKSSRSREKRICLTAAATEHQMQLSVEIFTEHARNHLLASTKTNLSGTCYEEKILHEIAVQYQGAFQMRELPDRFILQMILYRNTDL